MVVLGGEVTFAAIVREYGLSTGYCFLCYLFTGRGSIFCYPVFRGWVLPLLPGFKKELSTKGMASVAFVAGGGMQHHAVKEAVATRFYIG